MSTPNPFLSEEDRKLEAHFLDRGWLIQHADDLDALDWLRRRAAELAAGHLGVSAPDDPTVFLDTIHERVTPERLNALRLAVIQGINADPYSRPAYFRLAKRALESLVGNELAMQRRLNLSIQLPADDSSLLPVHADVWSGDSPFEVVVWVPLVNCYRTKSMYILSRDADRRLQSDFERVSGMDSEALFHAIAADIEFLDVDYGQILVFSQNLAHGNRINREASTRWSMNCRFKSLLAPYADKRLGEFFEPLNIRPATRLGMEYRLPKGFS